MPTEPVIKRVIAFIDGQNLYHAVKEAFGYPYPNYDVLKLAHAVSEQQGWKSVGVQFYTGVPEATAFALRGSPYQHFRALSIDLTLRKERHTG